jgi:hypothetical protein
MAAIKTIKLSQRRWQASQQIGARLGWEAARWWQRLGPLLLLALLCLLGAGFAWRQTHVARQQQQQLQQQIEQAKNRTKLRPGVLQPSASELDLARQIAAFYAYLPAHAMLPDQVKHLLTLAQKSGVTLAQAEYKPVPEPGAAFLRYQMILPVKAEHAALQNFMQVASRELPTLILESVLFKRERGDSPVVEARLQYQLLVKKPQGRGGQP